MSASGPGAEAPGTGPARRPGPARRRLVVVVLAALALTGALTWALTWALTQRGSTMAQEQDPVRNREAMTAVLRETAEAVGVGVDTVEDDGAVALTCRREDGTDGTYLALPSLRGGPVDDVPGLLADIRRHWEGRGYRVEDRRIGEVRALTATTTEGAVLRVLSGPGGTVLSGDTLCGPDAGSAAGAPHLDRSAR